MHPKGRPLDEVDEHQPGDGARPGAVAPEREEASAPKVWVSRARARAGSGAAVEVDPAPDRDAPPDSAGPPFVWRAAGADSASPAADPAGNNAAVAATVGETGDVPLPPWAIPPADDADDRPPSPESVGPAFAPPATPMPPAAAPRFQPIPVAPPSAPPTVAQGPAGSPASSFTPPAAFAPRPAAPGPFVPMPPAPGPIAPVPPSRSTDSPETVAVPAGNWRELLAPQRTLTAADLLGPAAGPPQETAGASTVEGEEERLCRRCNTANPVTALYCWQCFSPLAAAGFRAPSPSPARGAQTTQHTAPPPVAQATGVFASPPAAATRQGAAFPSAAASGDADAAMGGLTRRRRWLRPVAGVAIAAAVVTAAVVVAGMLRTPHVTMPASLVGMNRIESPETHDFESRITALGRSQGVGWKAAVYGYPPSAPSFFVLAAPGTPPEPSAETFRLFAAGFSAASASKVDLDALSTRARGGSEFVCAPTQGRMHGTLCEWNDGNTIGFVFSFHDHVEQTLDLSAVVRTAVER